MESTVNKLFDFTYWTDDTMGPYKTGFQKQSLKHTYTHKSWFHFSTRKGWETYFNLCTTANVQNTTRFSFLWQSLNIQKISILYCELPKQKSWNCKSTTEIISFMKQKTKSNCKGIGIQTCARHKSVQTVRCNYCHNSFFLWFFEQHHNF